MLPIRLKSLLRSIAITRNGTRLLVLGLLILAFLTASGEFLTLYWIVRTINTIGSQRDEYIWGLVACVVLTAIARLAMSYTTSRVTSCVYYDFYDKGICSVLGKAYDDFKQRPISDYVDRLSKTLELSGLAIFSLLSYITSLIVIGGIALFTMNVSRGSASFSLYILCPVVFVLVGLVSSKKLKSTASSHQKFTAELTKHTINILENFLSYTTRSVNNFSYRDALSVARKSYSTGANVALYSALPKTVIEPILVIGFIGVAIGSEQDIAATLGSILGFLKIIGQLQGVYVSWANAHAYGTHLDRFVEIYNKKTKAASVISNSQKSLNIEIHVDSPDIVVNGDLVSYRGEGKVSLRKLVEVKGPSGAGKSLFLQGACGLRQASGLLLVSEGQCLNIENTCISFLDAEPRLLSGRLMDYLRDAVGIRDSDDDVLNEMREIISQSYAYIFLNALDDDTILSCRTEEFSYGQKQRIAILKEILRRPVVMILDEATNGVDESCENELIETCLNEGAQLVIVTRHSSRKLRLQSSLIEIDREKRIRLMR